jgi:predicted  nucleic acid-binding Zn-ribbon protein
MKSETHVATATLRTLHRIHRQLDDLKDRLQRGPRIALAREANVQRMESELAKQQEELSSLRKATDNKQGQLASGEAMIEKRRLQLRQAGDNREYQALQDEIAAIAMANSVLEDEILEALDKLDQRNARIDQARAAVARARQEATKARQEITEQEPKIQRDLERLQADLKRCEAELPGDFRELYRRVVRQKGEDALASVTGEFCDGCNQHVPVNLINELMLNRPATCKACGRLLYLPEDYLPR